MYIKCPYLDSEVEFNDEREKHITDQHPDILPQYRDKIIETVKTPDEVRNSNRFARAKLFSKWYDDVKNGKYVVVVIVSEEPPKNRHWIITSYISRKLMGGKFEWKRS